METGRGRKPATKNCKHPGCSNNEDHVRKQHCSKCGGKYTFSAAVEGRMARPLPVLYTSLVQRTGSSQPSRPSKRMKTNRAAVGSRHPTNSAATATQAAPEVPSFQEPASSQGGCEGYQEDFCPVDTEVHFQQTSALDLGYQCRKQVEAETCTVHENPNGVRILALRDFRVQDSTVVRPVSQRSIISLLVGVHTHVRLSHLTCRACLQVNKGVHLYAVPAPVQRQVRADPEPEAEPDAVVDYQYRFICECGEMDNALSTLSAAQLADMTNEGEHADARADQACHPCTLSVVNLTANGQNSFQSCILKTVLLSAVTDWKEHVKPCRHATAMQQVWGERFNQDLEGDKFNLSALPQCLTLQELNKDAPVLVSPARHTQQHWQRLIALATLLACVVHHATAMLYLAVGTSIRCSLDHSPSCVWSIPGE